MKEFRFKIILILAAIGLSIYLLYPTYQNYTNNEKISKFVSNRQLELKDAQPNISKIELDKVEKFIEDSIKASDPNIAKTKAKSIKLGLDLQGGMRVVLEVNTGKYLKN